MKYVDFCNNGAAAAAAGEFLPLTVEGRAVGYLRPRWGGQWALCAMCACLHVLACLPATMKSL